jgi:hypothetical protein
MSETTDPTGQQPTQPPQAEQPQPPQNPELPEASKEFLAQTNNGLDYVGPPPGQEVNIDNPADAELDEVPAAPKEKLDRMAPATNVEVSQDCSSPLTDKIKAKFDGFETISLLNCPTDVFAEIMDQIPNLDLASSEDGQKWVALLDEARQYNYRGNALMDALTRKDSMWRQSVKNGVEELRAGRPRLGDNTDPANRLTGERAVLKMQAVLGLGAIVQIPLWHSGIWLSLKAPSEAELLELERRIAMEKVALGRYTNGLIFSSTAVYTNMFLVNLALSKVYDATVKDISADALKKIIKLSDLPTLIWALAGTVWPNGYPYKQPCLADPANCTHVMEELLNISKLSFTDNRAFTESQCKHMSNRNAKHTPEALAKYQEDFKFQDGRTFEMADGAVAVDLRVPTLADYEESGYDWVDSIVNNTDSAFGTAMTDNERNAYIVNQGKATALRQYGHWIERLVLAGDGGIIEDRQSIDQSVTALSANGAVQEEFLDGIRKYIDSTTVSLIAVPRYECPSCHKDANPEDKKHPHLVPLDVARVFFTQLGQRSFKVTSRLAI